MDERIRLRDKRYEGEETKRNRRRRDKKIARHFESVHLKGHYLQLHKDRVEFHRQRVQAEERFLRNHGVSPLVRGSALKFDKLMKKRS
jgi:hypothetical protein